MMIEASEYQEHIAFVKWLRMQYPDLLFFHVPNGETRGIDRTCAKAVGQRLNNMGLLSGVWDLFFPELMLWIEVKRSHTGRLSKEQKLFQERMKNYGYQFIVANGWIDGVEKFIEFLINKKVKK